MAGGRSKTLFFLWLIFFLNAAYMITGYFHLSEFPSMPMWVMISILLLSFVVARHFAGFIRCAVAASFLGDKNMVIREGKAYFFVFYWRCGHLSRSLSAMEQVGPAAASCHSIFRIQCHSFQPDRIIHHVVAQNFYLPCCSPLFMCSYFRFSAGAATIKYIAMHFQCQRSALPASSTRYKAHKIYRIIISIFDAGGNTSDSYPPHETAVKSRCSALQNRSIFIFYRLFFSNTAKNHAALHLFFASSNCDGCMKRINFFSTLGCCSSQAISCSALEAIFPIAAVTFSVRATTAMHHAVKAPHHRPWILFWK